MLKRLVDGLLWLGRYVERAENTARIVDVNYHATTHQHAEGTEYDHEDDDGPFSLNPWSPTEPKSMVQWLILDDNNPSSVAACLENSHQNAQTVRNKIDEESWECINRAYLNYGSPDPEILEDNQLHKYCMNVKRIINEFTGTIESTMFRGEEWYYLTIGRYLERADNCLRQLKIFDAEYNRDETKFKSRTKNRIFLESIGATMLLQEKKSAFLNDPNGIREFLLTSSESPRSLLFLLNEIELKLAGLNTHYYSDRGLKFNKLSELLHRLRTDSKKIVPEQSYSDWLKRLADVSSSLSKAFKRESSASSPQNDTKPTFQSQQ